MTAIKILTNNVGGICDYVNDSPFASTHADYDLRDVVSGSRSKVWRSTLTLADKGITYGDYTNNHLPDHCVIARADKLLTQGTYRVTGVYSGSYTSIAGFDLNPLTAANLIGPRSQDLVVAFTPSLTNVWGAKFVQLGSDPEAAMISKLYFGIGFDFGQDVTPKSTQIKTLPRSENVLAYALRGDLPFEIEQQESIVWQNVTTAKIDEFLSLNLIEEWPFFIYDPDTYLFPWKLEHVILESYRMTHKNLNYWDLQLNVARLKHYD